MTARTKKDLIKELAQELDVFDSMLSALVEILEEKGVLTQEEWENKIRSKIHKTDTSVLSYREIQTSDEGD